MIKKTVQPDTAEPMTSRHLHARGVQLGLPISGTFELTARCNFNCRMCYVHLQDAASLIPRELTADQWLSLASDARDAGMIFLLLTGGEPFIRKDFPYLYTELVKMGIVVSINSNASLYNDELRELFLRYPPSRVNVTLYGGSEETYRRLCGSASYEKVVHNLRSMKEDGLHLRLNVSLTPYNVCDMEKIHEISADIGLHAKAASYMYPPVRVGGEIGVNYARFRAVDAGAVMARWNVLRCSKEEYLEKAGRIRAGLDAGMNDTCTDVEQEGVLCRAGRCSFWMTWDGRMLPCGTMDTEASYPLRDGFRAAWDEVRARTAAIRLPRECAACPIRSNCGVCASICKGETGSFDGKPTYMCDMMRSQLSETVRIAELMEVETNDNDNNTKESENEDQV